VLPAAARVLAPARHRRPDRRAESCRLRRRTGGRLCPRAGDLPRTQCAPGPGADPRPGATLDGGGRGCSLMASPRCRTLLAFGGLAEEGARNQVRVRGLLPPWDFSCYSGDVITCNQLQFATPLVPG